MQFVVFELQLRDKTVFHFSSVLSCSDSRWLKPRRETQQLYAGGGPHFSLPLDRRARWAAFSRPRSNVSAAAHPSRSIPPNCARRPQTFLRPHTARALLLLLLSPSLFRHRAPLLFSDDPRFLSHRRPNLNSSGCYPTSPAADSRSPLPSTLCRAAIASIPVWTWSSSPFEIRKTRRTPHIGRDIRPAFFFTISPRSNSFGCVLFSPPRKTKQPDCNPPGRTIVEDPPPRQLLRTCGRNRHDLRQSSLPPGLYLGHLP